MSLISGLINSSAIHDQSRERGDEFQTKEEVVTYHYDQLLELVFRIRNSFLAQQQEEEEQIV
jgi:hypothetical protein